MRTLDSLAPAEQAKQLGNPEGEAGVAIAAELSATNGKRLIAIIAALDLRRGNQILEIGYGNGHFIPTLLARAPDLTYTGIDISETMRDEDTRRNAAFVTAGKAFFRLASADNIPAPDNYFDRVFASGVKHFWADPARPLEEIHRVLKPGGLCIMGSLDPRSAEQFPFARPEFGFHTRTAAEWEALHRAAGFGEIRAETEENHVTLRDGTAAIRYGVRVTARK